VRLIDHVFRQGHLSERALLDALVAGARPAHLDRCDLCAERAVNLSRWLDQLQSDAQATADDVFTPERLAAQGHQILRRLEQIDSPARIISFPAAMRLGRPEASGRRVSVSWVGVAAAAGLVLGIAGGQISAWLIDRSAWSNASLTAETTPVDSSFMGQGYDTLEINSLGVLNDLTPRLNQVASNSGG
jgi:hypothetical protein